MHGFTPRSPSLPLPVAHQVFSSQVKDAGEIERTKATEFVQNFTFKSVGQRLFLIFAVKHDTLQEVRPYFMQHPGEEAAHAAETICNTLLDTSALSLLQSARNLALFLPFLNPDHLEHFLTRIAEQECFSQFLDCLLAHLPEDYPHLSQLAKILVEMGKFQSWSHCPPGSRLLLEMRYQASLRAFAESSSDPNNLDNAFFYVSSSSKPEAAIVYCRQIINELASSLKLAETLHESLSYIINVKDDMLRIQIFQEAAASFFSAAQQVVEGRESYLELYRRVIATTVEMLIQEGRSECVQDLTIQEEDLRKESLAKVHLVATLQAGAFDEAQRHAHDFSSFDAGLHYLFEHLNSSHDPEQVFTLATNPDLPIPIDFPQIARVLLNGKRPDLGERFVDKVFAYLAEDQVSRKTANDCALALIQQRCADKEGSWEELISTCNRTLRYCDRATKKICTSYMSKKEDPPPMELLFQITNRAVRWQIARNFFGPAINLLYKTWHRKSSLDAVLKRCITGGARNVQALLFYCEMLLRDRLHTAVFLENFSKVATALRNIPGHSVDLPALIRRVPDSMTQRRLLPLFT